MILAKKSLGQNFLTDKNILRKIVSLSNINQKSIIEIGPGTGNLTEEILKHNPLKLILIEKDKKLSRMLEQRYKLDNRVKVYNKDILTFNLEEIIKKQSIVYGNLPYNISTQILIKFVKFKIWLPNFTKLIFMFQKEVANRIVAQHNTSDYGRLKIITSWRFHTKKCFNISKNCFSPKPKVESSVLSFVPIKNNQFNIQKVENLEKITQIFFSNKRKMINKNFFKLFENHNVVAKKLNIDLSLRPNQLNENNFYKIVEYYEKNKKT